MSPMGHTMGVPAQAGASGSAEGIRPGYYKERDGSRIVKVLLTSPQWGTPRRLVMHGDDHLGEVTDEFDRHWEWCDFNIAAAPLPPPPQPAPDNVTLPGHYGRFKIEPIRFAAENGLDFFQSNVVKYVCRHDAKNGIEDLKKARRYLDMYIAFKEGREDWWTPASSPQENR